MSDASRIPAGPTLRERAASKRRGLRIREALISGLLRVCAFSAVAGLLLIMIFVFREALPVLTDSATQKEASLSGFFATPLWQPVGNVPKYGIVP
jgi:phosphate transport system permease protein